MDDDEWSVVDLHGCDLEVAFQFDFVSWLQSHALADQHPSLTFSKHLQIGFCGLFWLLRTSQRPRTFTGNDRLLFAIDRVHPIGTGYQEIGHARSQSQGQEVLGTEGDWKGDPFEAVEKSAPELGREIRCKGFICAQSVEVAESFGDVLDALFEFSDWYAHVQREGCDTQQVIEDDGLDWQVEEDGLDWQVEENRIKALKVHAQEASLMCRTAREAVEDASKTVANMLDEDVQRILIKHLKKSARHSANEISSFPVNFWTSEAIHNGFILQWCTVGDIDAHSCIELKLEMGELFLEGIEADAVNWVGIDIEKPLRIRINIRSRSAKVSQEEASQDLEEGSGELTMGTTFMMEMVRKQLQGFQDGGWALDKENTETLSCRRLQTVDRNVFVRILQEAARYVMDLSSSICAVCGEARWDENEVQDIVVWAAPCRRALCQAVFEKWSVMRIAPSTDISLDGWGFPIEVQDDDYQPNPGNPPPLDGWGFPIEVQDDYHQPNPGNPPLPGWSRISLDGRGFPAQVQGDHQPNPSCLWDGCPPSVHVNLAQ